MAFQLKGNYLFVNKDEPCFLVSSNFTNYLEIGSPGTNDFFLVASIQDGQHLIDATLFDNKGRLLCRVNKNHLEAADGSNLQIKTRPEGGFTIISPTGERVMTVTLNEQGVCRISGEFYDRTGTLIAKGDEEDFRIFRGPAVIGKSGVSRGIVIGAMG